MATKSVATEIDVDGVMVRLTNPDKPYFPALGAAGTKGALVDYYRAVAEPMVALLRNRPTHLQRFPDGIDGEDADPGAAQELRDLEAAGTPLPWAVL